MNSRYILSSNSLSKNTRTEIYITSILPVVWYGCETWSLILGKKNRMRVFGKRVLRRIFDPMMAEVIREWRKLHNEELNDIRLIESRIMRWAGHVARI
jgi:hypothetical protein